MKKCGWTSRIICFWFSLVMFFFLSDNLVLVSYQVLAHNWTWPCWFYLGIFWYTRRDRRWRKSELGFYFGLRVGFSELQIGNVRVKSLFFSLATLIIEQSSLIYIKPFSGPFSLLSFPPTILFLIVYQTILKNRVLVCVSLSRISY